MERTYETWDQLDGFRSLSITRDDEGWGLEVRMDRHDACDDRVTPVFRARLDAPRVPVVCVIEDNRAVGYGLNLGADLVPDSMGIFYTMTNEEVD